VAAIYASENGEGMAFEVTDRMLAGDTAATEPQQDTPPPEAAVERPTGKPILTRVK
jgi:stringent starvation protein B